RIADRRRRCDPKANEERIDETESQPVFERGRDRGSPVADRLAGATRRAADRTGRRHRRPKRSRRGSQPPAQGPGGRSWECGDAAGLRTTCAKMVVTDDQGRYVLPDLPKANYTVWVRGYGLVDSSKLTSAPGKILNLNAVPASNAAAAAEYYPAIYWYSMLKV